MSPSSIEYLRHILDETNYLMRASDGLSKNEFMHDETLQRAFVRSIEVIGEATKNVSNEIRSKYSHIEWRSIAGMRDRLIHHYFGIDYDIVWDVVVTKVPALQEEVAKIIKQERAN